MSVIESAQVRKKFLDFFKSKGHVIVPSAPMVVKDDPTLMFINAGMNQFKEYFLGNKRPANKRIADTQKCLRVSGKHNDLEEVGVDTYHHTMFEMLGNWSFGDYFKKEAIEWAWELLVTEYGIDPKRLYVTVFSGDEKDGLSKDQEALDFWRENLPADRILEFGKKDNFWEMGDIGPCGPCSEIHVDLRSDEERAKIDGATLVNADHPQVIELWNLVFIEFNRKSDGTLEELPEKHVDTGLGFERLCRVLQEKSSNYDTDVFQVLIAEIEKLSGVKYGNSEETDIAQRVIADHVRAVSFAIADGQLPYRDGAGYVIRRILRRAIRYGYSFLNMKEPFINELVSALAMQMSDVFPELKAQQETIEKIIREEETSFLRTLESGIKRLNNLVGDIDGKQAFELYDTFGFPIDLTSLIAREKGSKVDLEGFDVEMQAQKDRARKASNIEVEDWIEIHAGEGDEFIGYDNLEASVKILKHRKVNVKGKEFYQLVFDKTPFYPEGGGQIGDTGYIESNGVKTIITDTKKENNQIMHFCESLPAILEGSFSAHIDANKRALTTNNHTATHLLHASLRSVLATHVEQRGSLVNEKYLRFDFSNPAKIDEGDLANIEEMVNAKIAEDITLDVRQMSLDDAKELGAMALFGEKYGEKVRVVIFDEKFSIELCGGTHVPSTKVIDAFKITVETSVASGIRRIEAVTADIAREKSGSQKVKLEKLLSDMEVVINMESSLDSEDATQDQLAAAVNEINQLKIPEQLKFKKEILAGSDNFEEVESKIETYQSANSTISKSLEKLKRHEADGVGEALKEKIENINGVNCLIERVDLDADSIKNIGFKLNKETDDLFMVIGSAVNDKAMLTVIISDNLVKDRNLDASKIIRELATEIQGGGGGQPFYATAGGKNVEGIVVALEKAKSYIE